MSTTIFDSRLKSLPPASHPFGWGLEGIGELAEPWELFEPPADPDAFRVYTCPDCGSDHCDADCPSGRTTAEVTFPPFDPAHLDRRPVVCVATGYDYAWYEGTHAGFADGLPVPPESYGETLRYAWLRGWAEGQGYRDDRRAFERDRDRVLARAGR